MDRALSAQVQVYWSNFARSNFARFGDPNGGFGGGSNGTIQWPMAYLL
jgi:hypothetical protein